uniref:Reverse transcriptase zinc-binding domain-containing protein n=1 Tax=Davidia involucrata TaxID=16924 RepID=A0A5B7ACY1_DAVIN
MALDREAVVSDYASGVGEGTVWCPTFRRRFLDWEVEEFARLLSSIEGARLAQGQADRFVWTAHASKVFSVKSFYEAWVGREPVEFPWRLIWMSGVPKKVSFFAWTVCRGAISTLDNLQKRGFYLANRCCMCKEETELVDHLLLRCPWAKELWQLILSLFGVPWVFPGGVKGMFFCWEGARIRKDVKPLWRMAPLRLVWSLWGERNRRSFEDKELPLHRLKYNFLCLLHFWAKEAFPSHVDSFVDFMESFRL